MNSPNQAWTTRRLLNWTTQRFEDRHMDHARLCAEMLLAHVLGVQRIKLYMDMDRPANDLERAAFRDLVERASKDEPVDYLVGHTPFYGLIFKVTPAVLVPRPSTETIIDHVIQHSRATPGFTNPVIADIGTGSGTIAVTLAKNLPDAHIVATDICDEALAIAKENAQKMGVADRIEFHLGNLLEPVLKHRFEYIISNPPYIPDHEWEAVEPNVKNYEPHGALRGGVDGLDCIRILIAQAKKVASDPCQLLIEFATSTKLEVLNLATEHGWKNPYVLADHERLDRILVANA
ncbi:MAG: peptide chain release factor N(5)-glutamine methyltransferase [Phycisphaeraceae bacterium]|nr:peptide chain release factor N(5)-glutamine methyltransferase [Phycisphaeraceae bacterium]